MAGRRATRGATLRGWSAAAGKGGETRASAGLRRPRLCPAGRTEEVGTHPPRTPRSGAADRGREPPGAARATARPAESCQAGALRRPPALAAACGAQPGTPPAYLSARLRPLEGPGWEAGSGRPLRKALVTWGVAGGWAAFRTGGGRQDEEAEGGRGGRAAGIRRPRPWQVGGLAGRCRHSGGSRCGGGGGGGGCSCGSLRIFLGLAQDGGAACTGFPVTLAMGRTTKEGGRMRAQPAEPGRGWWRLT